MANSPITDRLEIRTVQKGFYKGFNPTVSLISKVIVTLLVLALIASPTAAATQLQALKALTLTIFAAWYINLLGVFVIACAVLVVLPVSGVLKLGKPSDVPEYSTQSWLSMMVCAGIGIGILVFSVSEPVAHSVINPDILAGETGSGTITSAMRFTYLHWGVSAWSCYAIVALSLGLNCHGNDQPMTMRSALVPLFGARLEGWLGNVVDILSILAIIAGITTTIVLGLEQICSGLSVLTGSTFFADFAGDPPLVALLTAMLVALSIVTTSILSGVDRGVKWISNLGLLVAFGVLLVFLLTGPVGRLMGGFADAGLTYLRRLPSEVFTVYGPSSGPNGAEQAQWQADWTIFYWAWWIAFAPFVGLFLARISRGRTVREFILGAVIMPTVMCFIWFSTLGGSALLLEADGIAQGKIVNAAHAFRIYQTVDLVLDPAWATIMKGVIVFLFLILIVASTSAAIIAIKSIGASGATVSETPLHSMIWALVIAGITGAVMAVGGVASVRDIMIVGAVPFSGIMALMLVSILRLVLKAGSRSAAAVGSARTDFRT
ncbi:MULTISPECIES: BCCT family transporter [Roseobacter]|uniref:BCCT family transporter n=1 Tax=Roseobacter TaxID=2433 RepID=UPI001BBA4F81|nr:MULTISPECIES: BCCT family transporter [Roseobacter]GIT88978.1 choline transporter [Roseobacter sp. OBYS 0001]